MTSIAITTQITGGACLDQADLFASDALDYSPTDSEFADFTAEQHATAAAAKVAAETAAVAACNTCPLLNACRADVIDQVNQGIPVYGVSGGLTDADRAQMIAAKEIVVADPTAEITTTLRDRGARKQVDDAAVARLDAQGMTAEEIAREMDCSERTVVRARARNANRAAEAATVTEIVVAEAPAEVEVTVETILAAAPARPVHEVAARFQQAPATRSNSVSPAMRAIYAVLADGQWHQRDELLTAGITEIDQDDAIEWFNRINTVTTADGPVINPNRAHLSVEERTEIGARDKVNNMLSASCRTRKNTERGGPAGNDRDLYRITAKGMTIAADTREQAAA